MTVSMRVMSAGTGYRYLLNTVAVADGRRQAGLPLTAYYTAEGTPPGRWLGSGLPTLADGTIRAGDVVTEQQLGLLLGAGRDPSTGAPLGLAYPTFPTRAERVAARFARLDVDPDSAQWAAAVARIESEEAARPQRRAVAGFDLTFSVPKSVSVLWALAPADVQAEIVAAHHAAIDDVLALFERDVAATRMGANGPDGAVAQVDVAGVAAVAFDHHDSRAGDPQLHTHVVIATKVKTIVDGRWRSLDSRPVHAAMVALSEHYNAVLADQLTARLGVVWRQRDRGADRNVGWELDGIPERLLEAFSARTGAIGPETDRLIADYVDRHGHQPSTTAIIRLRQQATLATRPEKAVRPLAELMAGWPTRATALLERPAAEWAAGLLGRGRVQQQVLTAEDVSERIVAGVAGRVVEVVGERRATWRRWNLHAEASRQLAGIRFATSEDRLTVLDRTVAEAEQRSLRLSPPDLAVVPVELQRADGTSVFRPRHSTVFTSHELLAAEDRLLELGRTRTGPTVPPFSVAAASGGLGADQAAAVAAIAGSGRVMDVLIGPAGAGKTTAMRSLHHAWTSLYGAGTVLGLAPSAAAAQVLADDLDVATETLAKWLHDHEQGVAALSAGQLVIIDEASLAGTHSLHAIADHAARVGAKVLLVGDPAQLAAVDAGGALRLLADDRDDVAELTDVRRFHHPWEAAATLQLRDGEQSVLEAYASHGRLADGDTDVMLDRAYAAWQADLAAGRSSLLIAPTRDTVTALNQRAQTDRAAVGDVDLEHTVGLHDGTSAGVGDAVVTRRNDRRLHGPGGWVRNGDRWTVTATHPDGRIDVRRDAMPHSSPMRLPAAYVRASVELGYAVTAHRAQGATVDTAHAIVDSSMSRDTMYVAMTRGPHANHAYTRLDTPDLEAHHDHDRRTGRQVLEAVLARAAAEPSAHRVIAAEQDRAGSIAQLAAEYDTIAALAQRDRWTTLIRRSGLTPEQAERALATEAFGPLCAALRRADAHHHDLERVLPMVVAVRPIGDTEDVAAVLQHRLARATTRRNGTSTSPAAAQLIAGLIPQAAGPMPDGLRQALEERQRLIEQRATDLARDAFRSGAAWIDQLGRPPADTASRRAWLDSLTTIAAYRDRHAITGAGPLGDRTRDPQHPDVDVAAAALEHAHQFAKQGQIRHAAPEYTRRRTLEPPGRSF